MGSTSTGKHDPRAQTLDALGVPHETRVVSAHRIPICSSHMRRKQKSAASKSSSPEQAVLRICPECRIENRAAGFWCSVESKALKGLDSLLSIAQMPGGIPSNAHDRQGWRDDAALLAAASLGNKYPKIAKRSENSVHHKPKSSGSSQSRQIRCHFRAQEKGSASTIGILGWCHWVTCSHSPVIR